MPDTVSSLGLTIAFVLPGFIVADLAESQRATRAGRGDLELVLRGLVYALLLQGAVALTGWTGEIVDYLEGGWQEHLVELAVFAIGVGILAPTALGLTLSWWLGQAEERGRLRPWHYALGGRDHREAWDYVFSRNDGAFLLFTVTEDGQERHFAASYGPDSWASQAPTQPQDVYLEEVWPADSEGRVRKSDLERKPPRGMWISADKIDRLEVLHLPEESDGDG